MCVINGYGAFCPSMSGIIKHNRQFSKHSSLKKVQHAIHVDQCTVMPIYMNQSTKSINVINVLNTNWIFVHWKIFNIYESLSFIGVIQPDAITMSLAYRQWQMNCWKMLGRRVKHLKLNFHLSSVGLFVDLVFTPVWVYWHHTLPVLIWAVLQRSHMSDPCKLHNSDNNQFYMRSLNACKSFLLCLLVLIRDC